MQQDLHYNAVLLLAQHAGFNGESARIIATASQFVDDYKEEMLDQHYQDIYDTFGSVSKVYPTAHHWADGANITTRDQLYLWIPFHFLPSCKGVSIDEKLLCNGLQGDLHHEPRRELVKNVLNDVAESNLYPKSSNSPRKALSLIGVTCHILLDTFSHSGFSGINSKLNNVKPSSIWILHATYYSVWKNRRKFIAKFAQERNLEYYKSCNPCRFISRTWNRMLSCSTLRVFGSSGALGHAAVMTMTDLPFLKFRYKQYRKNTTSVFSTEKEDLTKSDDSVTLPPNYTVQVRDNLVIFKSALIYLTKFLEIAAKAYKDNPDYVVTGEELSSPKTELDFYILNKSGNKTERCKAWRKLSEELGYKTPEYEPIAEPPLDAYKPNLLQLVNFLGSVIKTREMVLEHILPKFGLKTDDIFDRLNRGIK